MANDISWTCPYCNQVATITAENFSQDMHHFNKNNAIGDLGLFTGVIVCPNSRCKQFAITAYLGRTRHNGNRWVQEGKEIQRWQLRPQSSAKPFPDYIPGAILQDYQEACLIADSSPKASATLSRRCLQGIIRDFWGIKKSRLIDEVNELKGKIDNSTWGAIDAVRSIGNIGAHMEKDINLIVDVEPTEASLLIHLIEVLLKEWYVARYEREEHMQEIIAAALSKAEVKNGGKTKEQPLAPSGEA